MPKRSASSSSSTAASSSPAAASPAKRARSSGGSGGSAGDNEGDWDPDGWVPGHDDDDCPTVVYPVISGPDDYSFQFKHWDNDGMCLDISGRIYFDAPGAQGASVERTVVGTLTAMSFARHRGGGFFRDADVTQDSMDMVSLCFDDFGRAKGALATVIKPKAMANRGTLLYLTEVIVDEAHRGKDLGLHFASACLDFFEEWSLAMTQPYPKDFWRNLDSAQQRDILDGSPRSPADVAECQRVTAKVARHFARLGFRQVQTQGTAKQYWYLERTRRNRMLNRVASKAAYRSMPVIQDAPKPAPPTLTPADKELLELVHSKAWQNGRDLSFANKVTKLKAAGADFQRCCLLHVLACMSPRTGETDLGKVVELVQLCVSLGADSNYSDPQSGCVPLHLAVNSRNEALVKYFLQRGADKQTQNHDGLTPLQAMEAEEQAKNDFLVTFNLGRNFPRLATTNPAVPRLRRLLA